MSIAAGYTHRQMPKVMISISDELLDRVDREVDARGTTRSAFLQEAARRELGWPDGERIDAALTRARNALTGTGKFDSTSLIREQRDARDEHDRRR